MAQKKFQVSQKCKLNGQTVYSTGFITCGEDDIDALVAGLKLVGEVSIMESRSIAGNADTEVGAHNVLKSISMTSEKRNKAGIYPSKRGWISENTLSADDVQLACANITPFEHEPTLKPEGRVYSSIQAGQTASVAG